MSFMFPLRGKLYRRPWYNSLGVNTVNSGVVATLILDDIDLILVRAQQIVLFSHICFTLGIVYPTIKAIVCLMENVFCYVTLIPVWKICI